ncbi:MAG: DUF1700 domain-containing protein [Clostridia bacterium]|nr:DUF1700 domain-containing protein [Clostridia bacterium]
MGKAEFLSELRRRLFGLPEGEVAERLGFYSEMIDDRMEEGLSEEEAVAAIGSMQEIYLDIVDDIPLSAIVRERIKPYRRMSPWGIVATVLSSPIWLSLLVALLAVVVSLYAAAWSVVVSLLAVTLSLAVACLGGVLGGLVLLFIVAPKGAMLLGAALVSGSFSVPFFHLSRLLLKLLWRLTLAFPRWLKTVCIFRRIL